MIAESLRKLLRNEAGNMGTLFALAAVPLMVAAGGGLDMMRRNNASTEVDAAMDGAVLAGTQYLVEHVGKTDEALAVARDYYANAVKDLPLSVNTVDFKLNSNENGIASFGQVEVKSSLLTLAGIEDLVIVSDKEAEAAVAEAGSSAPSGDLEVSLMLDVTGSMCSDGEGPCTTSSKLSALKAAANDLVEAVVWDDQSEFTSKVAIVPFSTRVRVAQDGAGSSIMKKLTDLGPTWSGYYKMCTAGSGSGASEGGGNWTCTRYSTNYYNNWKLMPCVTDRFYNSSWSFELTDMEPKRGYWLNAHDGGRMTAGEDSSATAATTRLGRRRSDPADHWNYSSDGVCADVAEANEVLPLTNNKTTLKEKINGLEAYGSTAGVLGTAFAWYMLSPEWKNVWTGQSQPQSYARLTETGENGKPKLRKIAILMTDGVYNTFRGWKDQDSTMVTNNAKQMCTNMKAKGIEIYTVGFELDSLPATDQAKARDMLSSCGSTVDHFYNSINAEQLKQAFKDISNNVAEVNTRLVK